MSVSSQAYRDFNKHISQTLNSHVKIILKSDYPNHYYLGTLVGFDINSQSICVENAINEKKKSFERIFISGESWSSFSVEVPPFPMKKLSERLQSILPAESINITDKNEISLLGGKIMVSEKGVEGKGPTAKRVQTVFDAFCNEI